MHSLIVALLVALGGQPFAGLTVGDGPMHRDCVELHIIVCSDGFIL